ncbi:IQ motif and ubiquitin-like domain-containing protein [Paralichthys olivaceus]|uniref:IQ motif and ubiquitin-like domain-containing protein n=1 Tax=Paralichthys olivaceus TaxID=8255 RepID=UPI003750A221
MYHALEKWRCEEEQQINSSMRGAERKAALCLLLDQETQFIAAIERHRIAYSSCPDFFQQNKEILQVVTLILSLSESIRARELQDLYNNVNLPAVSQEQRLHVLMTLKHAVKVPHTHRC